MTPKREREEKKKKTRRNSEGETDKNNRGQNNITPSKTFYTNKYPAIVLCNVKSTPACSDRAPVWCCVMSVL